ncbi:MAG: outer membrane protein assembly factor BamD [bacterium]|nr:outer membrane protein assembly factor BamD [bacterium]
MTITCLSTVRSARIARFCGVLLGGFSAVVAAADDRDGKVAALEYDDARGVWVERQAPVAGTAEGDLAAARIDHLEGRYGAAYKRTKKWLKIYGQEHPLYPEAAVLHADVERARKNYYRAHTHLKDFLNQYGASRAADEALRIDFNIAEVFLGGTKRKLWGMRMLPAEDLGIQILDDISANYPGSALAELAIKTKADYFYGKKDFALAELEYARLREQFPKSRYVRLAMRRRAEAALSGFPGIKFDDAPLVEAEARFLEYLSQYPGIAEQEGVGLTLDHIREQRAAKEVSVGDYYRRTGHPQAAAFYYRSTLTHWSETIAARQATDRLSTMGMPPTSASPPGEPEAPQGPSLTSLDKEAS